MARRTACFVQQAGGRPHCYRDGWDSVKIQIYLSKETLSQWRRLHTEQDLSSDNDVAVFLLERNRVLTDVHASQQVTAGHR